MVTEMNRSGFCCLFLLASWPFRETEESAVRSTRFLFMALLSLFGMLGCNAPSVPGAPGVPVPIKVLENPTTGERVRFFREIPFKVPLAYDEKQHIADWTAKQQKDGFTKEIAPEEDGEQFAELRRNNLATRPSQ